MSEEKKTYESLCDAMSIEPVVTPVSITAYSQHALLARSQKNERLTAALHVFVQQILDQQTPIEHVDKIVIDGLIANIDERIGFQIDEIVHHHAFKALESLWRSLNFLVERTDFQSNIHLNLLDVDKESLREDFSDVQDVSQSGLHKQVYIDDYDTPGGNPVSVMISSEVFENTQADIALLKGIAKVAASAHCPFIASVNHRFFGKGSMQEVAQIEDFCDTMDRAEYIHWNSFRRSEDARYIGLTLPHMLLRIPYGRDNTVKAFQYQEIYRDYDRDFLWGSSAFAFAANITRSFKAYGWNVSIRGPESGGKIDALPVHQYDELRGLQTIIPTQMLIPETKELALAELGFIPLSYYKGTNFACFFSANSVHKPKVFDDLKANANSRINARLPYVFLAARLGHYLKVIQRENIGAAKDKSVLEKELNQWLSQWTTAMPNPSNELIAKRPLKEARVNVDVLPENPGYFSVNLHAMPHFQVEGLEVKLSLVAQMPSTK